MKRLLLLVACIFLFSTTSPTFADQMEMLTYKANNKSYVGWELPDSFLTCNHRRLSKKGATIKPTAMPCPSSNPGPLRVTAEYEGTVQRVDPATKTIVIKTPGGEEHSVFVPASKAWILKVLRPNDEIRVGVDGKLGNRVETLRTPALDSAEVPNVSD